MTVEINRRDRTEGLAAMKSRKVAYAWLPEALRPYKPLYKGRRYWVFLNNPEQPFEGWTKDYRIIAYDINNGCVMAVGNYRADGMIDACFVGGQGVTFESSSPEEIVHSCLGIMKWYC